MTLVTTDVSAQQKPTRGYAPVYGINMYYEVHGGGEPEVVETACRRFMRHITSCATEDLKAGPFKPEYTGKMNFYLAAIGCGVCAPQHVHADGDR